MTTGAGGFARPDNEAVGSAGEGQARQGSNSIRGTECADEMICAEISLATRHAIIGNEVMALQCALHVSCPSI